ncbi:MAG: YciI family protein [Candidatus Thorarchaeota archaeon]
METHSFVIMLRPANDYGNEITKQKVSEHFNYLQRLLKDGILIMAGRFSEVLIGLVMIESESREHAQEIMMNDPAVKAGIFHAELYPWQIALRKE